MSWMTISIILLIFLLIRQSASVRRSCSAGLSNDFASDCDSGHLKNFALCLRNMNNLNSTIIADELNRQYCKGGECDFSCNANNELDNPGIMISCTCICDTGGQGIQKRGVITCNDCFKIDDINIRINAGSRKSVKILMIFATMMIAVIAY